MRAVVQRVKYASVEYSLEQNFLNQKVKNEIGPGLQVLLGITSDDTNQDGDYIVDKILGLRIFEDENEKMNLSIEDIDGEILLVSQFTLYGDARKGKRPSFSSAARPQQATALYQYVIDKIIKSGRPCSTGEFGTDMTVHIVNDGPVTILLDSKKNF